MNPEKFKYKETLSIGKYKVVARLRPGEHTQIYHCKHIKHTAGKEVILKLFIEDKKDLYSHVYDTYEALGEHNNLPIIEDNDSYQHDGFIVFPYTEFVNLEDYIREYPNGVPVNAYSLDIIRQLAEVIDHIHDKEFVHGDIKPSSILLTERSSVDGEDRYHVLLIDFDKAITSSQGKPVDSSEISKLTESSDNNALGKVVYQMFTGHHPDDSHYKEQLDNIISDSEVTSQSAMLGKIGGVLMQMLSSDPKKHYKSATAFHKALFSKSDEFIKEFESFKKAEEYIKNDEWEDALELVDSLSDEFRKSYRDHLLWLNSRIGIKKLETSYKKSLERGNFSEAISALNYIEVIDRESEFEERRKQALDAWYQEATSCYKEGDFLAAAEMFNGIYEIDPEYLQVKSYRNQAHEKVEGLKNTNRSYEEAIKYIKEKDWTQARSSLDYVAKQRPDDAAISILANLIVLLDEASAAFGSDKFVVCIEKLDELEQRDDTFQADYRISTRDEAIKGLVEQTNSLLDQGKLDESISKTQALAALAPDLPELEDLEQRVEVEQEFFDYYSEAIACLGNNDFEEAAKQCEKLKNSLRGAEHQDYIKDKLGQMLPHVIKGLYDQAANCLDEPDCQPENAKKLLALIKRLDPEFVDEQQLEAAIRDREKSERNRNIIILAILIVAAIVTGLALLNAFNTNERLNDTLQTTYEESTRHFEEREAKINDLEVEITRISKDKEATISAGQAEIDSLEEQVDGAIKVGENLATATSALATADANLYNIEKTVAAATIEIGSLRADLDEKETTVSNLEANLASTRAIVPVSLVLQNIEWSRKPISNPEPEDALFNYEVIEAIGKNEDSSFYKVRVKRDNEWVEGWISSVMFDAYVSFDENKLPIITGTPEVTGE